MSPIDGATLIYLDNPLERGSCCRIGEYSTNLDLRGDIG
jgi:hypothetical protein